MMLHAPLVLLAGLFAFSLVSAEPDVAIADHPRGAVALTFAALR